jgi:glutathione S-transferase
MLKLYDYSASANCYKVRLLLAQLGREYERVAIDIFDGDTLTPEFELLNPHRSTPVLELEDRTTLVESNAILWYLAHDTPLLPDDAVGQAAVCRWLIYEQTDVMPMIGGLRFRLVTGRFTEASEAAHARRAGAQEALAVINQHLAAHDFLAAERYTIADIAVYAYAHAAHEAGVATEPYGHFQRWLERIEAQPGYMDDLEPYPANASVLAGRSLYGKDEQLAGLPGRRFRSGVEPDPVVFLEQDQVQPAVDDRAHDARGLGRIDDKRVYLTDHVRARRRG